MTIVNRCVVSRLAICLKFSRNTIFFCYPTTADAAMSYLFTALRYLFTKNHSRTCVVFVFLACCIYCIVFIGYLHKTASNSIEAGKKWQIMCVVGVCMVLQPTTENRLRLSFLPLYLFTFNYLFILLHFSFYLIRDFFFRFF